MSAAYPAADAVADQMASLSPTCCPARVAEESTACAITLVKHVRHIHRGQV